MQLRMINKIIQMGRPFNSVQGYFWPSQSMKFLSILWKVKI